VLWSASAHGVVFLYCTVGDKSYSLLRMCVILWDENLRNLKGYGGRCFLLVVCVPVRYVYTHVLTSCSDAHEQTWPKGHCKTLCGHLHTCVCLS